MKTSRIFLPLLIISLLISCAPTARSLYPKPNLDDHLYAVYPKYRIDNKIERIVIIGNEPSLTSILTSEFMEWTDIKIVEPGNLQAILGGAIIEYGTGLTQAQSQALSQMLQVSHILLFDEKISPHRDYIYGGRAENKINLKILNTLTGEIIFQASSNFGALYTDPRKYGYGYLQELPTSEANKFRIINAYIIGFKLGYALGLAPTGIIPSNEEGKVSLFNVLVDSPAYRAGIKKGDNILEVNSIRVNNLPEYINVIKRLRPKQGDIMQFKIKRQEQIMNFKVELPVIPFAPEEPNIEKPVKKALPTI